MEEFRLINKKKQTETHLDKGAVFFYADEDIDIYDDTAELSTPGYYQLHRYLQDVLRISVTDSVSTKEASYIPCILDIGSGTGIESMAVWDVFPNAFIVALDISPHMHEILKTKIVSKYGEEFYRKNCKLIVRDISGSKTTATDLLKVLNHKKEGKSRKFDAVISALTLHHFTPLQFQRIYKTIYNVLEPGGVFLNGDVFDYQASRLSNYSMETIINWIYTSYTNPVGSFSKVIEQLGNRRFQLRDKWIDHCKYENILIPFESQCEFHRKSDRKPGKKSHSELLSKAGFIEFGCPYRYWQHGIIWARKD
jgi:SAM-dependent methyltransferase